MRFALFSAVLLAACGDDPVDPGPEPGVPVEVSITGASAALVQGDVVALQASVLDGNGDAVARAITWSLSPAGAGLLSDIGRLVAYQAGTVSVIATADGLADTAAISVTARGLSGSFTIVGGADRTDGDNLDFWIVGSHALSGTRFIDGSRTDAVILAWDVSTPAAPFVTDSVIIPALRLNDVKIRADGAFAVGTREVVDEGGIDFIGLADPAHPTHQFFLTDQAMAAGVHNVWIEGDIVYVATDATGSPSGMRIVDASLGVPAVVGGFEIPSADGPLHDIYVRDGLAFLSYWDEGLVILDVGGGGAGGAPTAPVELSRIDLDGNTHNAWYWPATGYVFVGEEDFQRPGIVRIVDASDPTAPELAATITFPGQTPHNFWLDEAREILYIGWYGEGLVAVDVSGQLAGDLRLGGRIITSLRYDGGAANCFDGASTCTFAPQIVGDNIWVMDLNNGLRALRPDF
ncbi:MAG: hypothetical protein ABFS34_02025 [Gemmatimonadota bacterium]